jgi:hypothetical protein
VCYIWNAGGRNWRFLEKLGIFENSRKNISVKFMLAALAQGVA